jgi:polyhydroxyalkanoate synthase
MGMKAGCGAARLGPRPLAQHLATAGLSWLGSSAAWRIWSAASAGSRPPGASPLPESLGKAAPELARALAEVDSEAFADALEREALARLDWLAAGIERYRNHAHCRSVRTPPAVWREGTTRLLDYRLPAKRRGAAKRPALLVVPSLVNRAYVLDLEPERSFLRFLAGAGFDPFLVDWQAPGAAERRFDLTDYIAGRLEGALAAVRGAPPGRPVLVVGYCMGGNLALALALRRQRELAGLALLATPWDFHAERAGQAVALGALGEALAPVVTAAGELSVDAIQALFGALDPLQVTRKFLAFAALDPASKKAESFVALEDWVNDGVPLAAAVAIECLAGWYGRNETMRGEWLVDGEPVLPQGLNLPTLVVVPGQDRIVPPGSAAALADAIPGADRLAPDAGHIGMVVGGSAETKLWRPLADWLAARG